MVQLQQKLYTFAEYLNYQDYSDNKYELVNGELIIMPTASGFHALIMIMIYDLLKAEIDRLQQSFKIMPGNVGIRTGYNKSRIPDLMIISQEQCQEIRNMTTAVLETPPLLVIEIVSSGNKEDDYRYKRSEYAANEIPEYWIVDPLEEKISILTLVAGFYEVTELRGDECLTSQLFPELNITVNQILNQ